MRNRHERPYVMQPAKPRIVEIGEFARKMGYRRLGLAFCIGLAKEAAVVDQIFQAQGFEMVSAACKAGRTPKESIGITDAEKIFQGRDEAMCNPIFQAMLLNEDEDRFQHPARPVRGPRFALLQIRQAPTTVLAVKDRVTGHNPLAAVYLADSYYRKIRIPAKKETRP